MNDLERVAFNPETLSFIFKMKHLVGGIFFISFIILIVLSFGTGKTPPPAESAFQQNESVLESVDLKQFNGNKVLFSISAGKIVYRKRAYKIFMYKNLKELFIQGLSIELHQAEEGGEKSKNSSNEMMGVLSELGNSQTSYKDFSRGSGDRDSDLLTRILIDGCSINILGNNGARITVNAGKAKIVDFKNIILEENVRIKNNSGAEISSAYAVWSTENNGFLFPEGYRSADFSQKNKAFLKIGKGGDFYPEETIPSIKYADAFEENEKRLFDAVTKNAPGYLRQMIKMSEDAI